jgi:hypothetical protein
MWALLVQVGHSYVLSSFVTLNLVDLRLFVADDSFVCPTA